MLAEICNLSDVRIIVFPPCTMDASTREVMKHVAIFRANLEGDVADNTCHKDSAALHKAEELAKLPEHDHDGGDGDEEDFPRHRVTPQAE